MYSDNTSLWKYCTQFTVNTLRYAVMSLYTTTISKENSNEVIIKKYKYNVIFRRTIKFVLYAIGNQYI